MRDTLIDTHRDKRQDQENRRMDGRTDGDRWTDRDRWTDSHRKTNRQSDGGQVKGRGDRGLTINRSLASRVKFEFEKRCGV